MYEKEFNARMFMGLVTFVQNRNQPLFFFPALEVYIYFAPGHNEMCLL